VTISGSVPGTGDDSQNGQVPFLTQFSDGSLKVFQRTALLLLKGTVYFGFGSAQAESKPYHGWVFGYDAATLKQTFIVATTPNGPPGDPKFPCTTPPDLSNVCGHAAGVWMSGRGIAGDPNLGIFYATGNGGVGDGNQGESVINYPLNSTTFNFFLPDGPTGYIFLNQNDLDFGTGGVLLPPSATSTLITMGKTGEIYVLDRANLGGFGDAHACQIFVGADALCTTGGCSEMHMPAYWDQAPNSTPLLYIWPTNQHLRAFALQSASNACGKSFNTTAAATNSAVAEYPGGALAVSSNNGKSGTGILWATGSTFDPSNAASVHTPTVWAFDAVNLNELWSATITGATRFNVPTVVNGKLYVPQSGPSVSDFKLLVYGLLVPGS
jgi:hypothetical protein